MIGVILLKKSEKKHKSLGRDLKKIFLPNKKYFFLVSDGIRNFLSGGWENLFLTSPPSAKEQQATAPRVSTAVCTAIQGLPVATIRTAVAQTLKRAEKS